jgi:probable HAF family extracellular repeat protein
MIGVMMKHSARALLMAASSSAALAMTPPLIDLGALTGGDYSAAYYGSENGSVIVGDAYLEMMPNPLPEGPFETPTRHAFSWTQAGGIKDLSTLGGRYSFSHAVSADGSTIVGVAKTSDTKFHAFFRRAGDVQMTDLGTFGGDTSYAYAVSANGAIVVGWAMDKNSKVYAARWAIDGGNVSMTKIKTTSGAYSTALGVSADGISVVGYASDDGSKRWAFRWTEAGGIINLDNLGGNYSMAWAVSRDGTVVAGDAQLVNGKSYAFRWTSASEMISLGAFGGSSSTFAGLSADGAVVVGYALDAAGQRHAFRWTETTNMKNLEPIGAWASSAAGVSADGSIVVGTTAASGRDRAFRWTEADGMKSLGTLGGSWSVAHGISADGSVIFGESSTGTAVRAFIYHDSVLLDAEDWLGSVNGVHSLHSMTLELVRAHMEGAHHRPLAELGRGRSFWSTGDVASSSRSRNVLTRSGEAGVTFAPKDNVLIGIGAGYGLQDQGLLNDGSARTFGQYLVGEIDLIQANGGIFSLLASFGDWRNTTVRGYVTGSGVDYSHGETTLASKALRVRYDSPVLARVYATDLKAYISYGHSKIRSDAYAETGGSFPGSFEAMEQTAKEGRLGLAASHVLGVKTTVRLSAEWIRRYDHDQAALTATDITSTISYSLGTPDPVRDQARVGLDVDHKLDDKTTLSFTVHAAGVGESPDVSGAISLRRAF